MERLRRHICYIASELLILCNEIGLRIYLYGNRLFLIVGNNGVNDSLCRDSSSLLCCAGKSLFTKEINRLVHIAVGSRKSLLAVHHSGAGHLS